MICKIFALYIRSSTTKINKYFIIITINVFYNIAIVDIEMIFGLNAKLTIFCKDIKLSIVLIVDNV